MKKLFSYILIFALGMATAAGAIFSPRAFAYAADGETSAQATTEIFLPTTYLQYYKLEKPYAICREEIDGKEFVAISHKGAIVLYSDGKFKEIKVEDLNAAQGVPSLQLYEQKYLLFSAGSKLWTIDTETNIATETEIAGNDFSICGNELAIATSSNISFYTLSTSSGGLDYAKETDKTISMNGVLSVLKSKNGKTYVVVVMVEHGGGGSSVAGPVAKKIYDYLFGPDTGAPAPSPAAEPRTGQRQAGQGRAD